MNKWLWGLALGLLTLKVLPVLPPWPWLAGAGAVVLLLSLRWRFLLPLAAFALGLCWAVFEAGQALDARIPNAWEGQNLTVRGRIVDLPNPLADGGAGFRLQPDCVLVGSTVCQPSGVLWQLSSRTPLAVRPNERWELQARVKRPHGFASPGAFDTEGWLLEEGVGATGYVLDGKRLASGGYSVDEFRLQVRERFWQAFGNEPEAGVQLALLTGDRALVPQSLWTVYSRTGITHLMAISGPHITLAGLVVMFFLRRLLGRVPRLGHRLPLPTICLLAGFLVSIAYGFLAGLGIPTERTLLMLAVAVWASWRRRELPAFAVLLRALVLVLLAQPTAVHAAGFWLSFFAVALLMLLAWSESGEPVWQEFGRTQLIATLGLLPLTIAIFARVSLVSPLANIIAIPLVTFVIVPLGMIGLLINEVWAAGGVMVWKLGILILHGLDWGLAQMAAWPWAALSLALTPLAMVSLVLAVACLLLPRGVPGRYLALFFLVPVVWGRQPLAEGGWRLAVLDVGQGLSVVVQTSHHTLVYDTGPAGSPGFDAGSRVLLPYLHWAGVSRVDTLMLSHTDLDHVGGAPALIQGLPVTQELGAWPDSLAGNSNLPHQPCSAGQAWTWDGVRFTVLYPWPGLDIDSTNNSSCVLKIEGAGQSVLLPGDMEHQGEAALLAQSPGALAASLLVLGHHGSATSSSEPFLEAVKPQQAVVSAGYRNRFHHPSPKVIDRLEVLHIPVVSTVADGTLSYVFTPGLAGLPAAAGWRQADGRYWMTRP